MKVLVTGSSGLIGSAVCQFLAAKGHDPVTMDVRPSPIKDFSPRFHDVTNLEELRKAVKNIDGIIHLAAVSRVIDAQRNPALCHTVNVEGTKRILTALSELQDPPWFVYGSSREVYGEPKSIPVAETHPLKPINIYGDSKVEAEKLLTETYMRHNAAAIIFRYSSVYGSVYDYQTRVIPAFIQGALIGEPLRVDCPEHVFDFTYVSDAAEATIMGVEALKEGKITGIETLNVSPGRGTSLKELVILVGEVTGKETITFRGEKRSYDVGRYVGDVHKLAAVLGYSCKTDLKEGLTRLCSEYKMFFSAGCGPI